MAKTGVCVEIDMNELEKLCMLHCSDKELADWFGVTTKIIERRRKEPEFGAVMERGRSTGKTNVSRMQMQLLAKGNATMAVWLGKQMLGRTEDPAHQPTLLIIGEHSVRPAIEPPWKREPLTIDLSEVEELG